MSLRSRLGLSTEPLYLMDGSAFVFRSFYALQNMSRSDGFPTNILFIVSRLLLKLLREEKPAYLAFLLDGKGPTFRHERLPAYKAQRSSTPEPLIAQLGPLKETLSLMGVPVYVSQGCEADDCIASLAARFRQERPVVVLGADKDLKQCLHDNVVLWDPAAKDEKLTTLEDFRGETGMEPSSWPDYQALVGDSSDNIPGVPKIGPKTAEALIRDFPHLEDIFDRLPAVPPKVRAKLEGQRENAFLYRELTTLQGNSCPELELDDLAVKPARLDLLLGFMREYELRSLAREVESMSRAGFFVSSAQSPTAGQAGKGAKKAAGPATRSSGKDERPEQPESNASKVSAREPGPEQAPGGRMGQGSLLSLAMPESVFIAASEPGELPISKDTRFLAVMPRKDGALLVAGLPANGSASQGWERLYTGKAEQLVPALAEQAGLILVTPDCKALGKRYPAFWALPEKKWFDLSLAAYLLSPEERAYGWEQVVQRFGEQVAEAVSFVEHPGLMALALCQLLQERLAGADLTAVFTGMELPLVPVLARMEERGITIDKKAFAEFLDMVQGELEQLTVKVHGLAGRDFNIRSSQQLSDVLFTVLELPVSGKTRGGAMSTSQEALEKLADKHPIVEDILSFRKLEKLRSTYLEPLPKLADAQDRIHTTFNQTATATGRLSSSNPNLQNIPIRGPLGERMRRCFIAGKGMSLVCADYSQIELRVLAHLSQDPTLLDAFHKNEDIHRRTASLLFDEPQEAISPDQRRNAKTINFGLVYGMGAQKLGREMHISLREAKAFIERYFERLSHLKALYDAVEQEAKEHGFVATMAGRRRLTPDILSQNNQLRAQARRQAINTRIQGSAADIIKLAMIAVENDARLEELGASLLLQIHDELLLEAPAENARAAGERLAELMSGVRPGGQALSVPLLVDWGVGLTWQEAH